MTKVPVVAYSERLGEITDAEQALLATVGAEVRRVPIWTADEARQNAADADVVIIGAVERADTEFLSALRTCRVLVRRGIGVNNVDLAAATRLGIPVAYVPDASVEEVSDHALALLIALERRLVPLNAAVHAAMWRKDPSKIARVREPMRRMAELTLGVVGFGRIGQALARKAAPLYGRVVASDPYAPSGDNSVHLVPLDALLATADHVSLHSPLTDETHHMFNATTLVQMKPGAILVNTARGGLVDEGALEIALQAGRLGAAGLDVTEEEPLPDSSPLLKLPNIILTAHSAASSQTANADLRMRAVEAVALALQGRRPHHVANPDVLHAPVCRLILASETR